MADKLDTLKEQLTRLNDEVTKAATVASFKDEFVSGFKAIVAAVQATRKELNEKIDARLAQIRDGKDGMPGVKGDKGDRGAQGRDGKAFIAFQGKEGTPGAPGRDGSPDTPEEVRDKLETLEGDERLDASAIKNLPELVAKANPVGTMHSSLWSLQDVDVAGISTNQSLKWDGIKWVAYTPSGGTGGAVDSVNGQTGDVVLTASDVGADADGAAATAQTNAKAYTDTEIAALDYQAPITLTTTGSSGAATFDGTTLNIPQYAGGSGGASAWGDITGTLSDQTDLQAELDAKQDTITGLTASGAELNILDGATLTTTELNYVDGVTSAIQTQLDGKAASLTADQNYVTDAQLVVIGNTSGTNTGDQSSIVGITGTKAQFDTAVSDGNILYVGDVTQYTDELAQDAVGTILVDSTEIDFTYTDATPSITASLKAGSIDETKLDTSVNASLDLADSAVQDLADLSITATAAELNILDGITASTAELNYTDGVTSAIQTQLDGKVDENLAITGATKTKITFDAKGLVTAGADATTADIADSLNKRYITDAELTVLGNTSGTNTGDQTSVTGNAGTATALQTARTIDGQSFDGTANITVVAPGTHAATGKTTPVDADELAIVDSAASNVLKKLTWANLKATLKTYFDTLYQAAGTYLTPTSTSTVTNKRNQPRTASSTTATTLTPDVSSANVYFRTTQTGSLTINAPTGTPVIGETIAIYVDSASAQTLTMDAAYKAFGAAFPAATTAGKTLMIVAQYNGTDWKTTWNVAQ